MDTVPLDDRGLLLGDGLFETILWRDGGLVLLEDHAARMAAGCQTLGLPVPEALHLAECAGRAIERTGLAHARAAVRLTLTAGSGSRGLERPAIVQARLFGQASESPVLTEPVTLATARVRRNANSPASRLKTLAYLDNVLARREARLAGAEEALMLNGRDEVSCAAAANVFWVDDDRLFTPALDCGVLEGVMRRQVLMAARRLGADAREVREPAEALASAQAIFLTSSLAGVRRATRLDGRELGSHPLIDELGKAVAEVS